MRRDLGLVPGEVCLVLLICHVGRRPSPGRPEDRPQPLAGAHHRGKVHVDVSGLDRPQVITIADRYPDRVHKISR